ncbi:RebB family R body protein [Vibrio mexicanus]|uniref:RebB family R body protein n=1 Tax=Vibrio mexicanus TaxID=1004326 RepID=UPI00063CC8C3|nr:RebB family R body protein [Vibrio mexicanus]
MEVDIKTMMDQFCPTASRNMVMNIVAESLGKSAQNATQVQQQIQTIMVTNTALGSGLIYSIAAKGA